MLGYRSTIAGTRPSKTIISVIGARKRSQLSESLTAVDVQLSSEEVSDLESIISASGVAGGRYDVQQMKLLDSEQQP